MKQFLDTARSQRKKCYSFRLSTLRRSECEMGLRGNSALTTTSFKLGRGEDVRGQVDNEATTEDSEGERQTNCEFWVCFGWLSLVQMYQFNFNE